MPPTIARSSRLDHVARVAARAERAKALARRGAQGEEPAHSTRDGLPFDGFSKALSIACNLVAAADVVLLIDEFEVSFHVGALHKIVAFVIEAAKRLNVQLFLSTHNLDTVDAFIELATPEDALYIIRLERPGAKTRLHNIDHAEARALREDIGLDLRRA